MKKFHGSCLGGGDLCKKGTGLAKAATEQAAAERAAKEAEDAKQP